MFTYQIRKICSLGYTEIDSQILLVEVLIGTTSVKNSGSICPNSSYSTFFPQNHVQNDSVQFILGVF